MSDNFSTRKLRRIKLNRALEEFRAVERVKFLLEQKERRLLQAVAQLELEDRGEYFDQSLGILEEYDSKRKKRGF